jgi:DNA invertase Pin-like site-specific DNA recombinase
VSTDKQTLYQYTDALTEYGCDKIYMEDAISASATDRPELSAAENDLTEGDAFVVLSIDRAFRSAIDALLFLDRINKRGVTFISIYQMIDTNTPEGRKWFTDSASNAEHERAIISRRTKDKMAAAKLRGQHLGRPYKLSNRKIVRAFRLINDQGHSATEIAKRFGVSPITMKRGFRRLNLLEAR